MRLFGRACATVECLCAISEIVSFKEIIGLTKKIFDNSITNTMEHDFISAQTLLNGTGVTLLDAARLIRNILDAKPRGGKLDDVQFCAKIIETGKSHIRAEEKRFADAFRIFVGTKLHLRPDSLKDIRYFGNRLSVSDSNFASRNMSEFSRNDCEFWLSSTFASPNQFNKARSFLHALFEFSVRREWCDKNPVKLVERKRVSEREIRPLELRRTKLLLKNSSETDCRAAVAILILAGIRPREVRRLEWSDVDLAENCITIRSRCSKTGGVRHVEICPALRQILAQCARQGRVCPPNWDFKWKRIRDASGFRGVWVQDILRHTYASYYAKHYRDLSRLQLNMGHCDLSLLNSRYVNMLGITRGGARTFFG